ncbi:DeoR/GlpR family DNA-binding transcription regulator [Halanaerobium hydrogeniformans]|uniref:Transcriptional regulator, DeoR family n=1 Tax=Halanaerobium hydrogeniformans TaxID=656519 RepID=E4RM39_HALHG|nr:DeoR/GlpR family DNA-binding transcription regulator [Halanaerobium hydrogeniformans]ADQ14122.1 transcriptional regulator, DeoR family [Halanaerobium hydrogeniformans]
MLKEQRMLKIINKLNVSKSTTIKKLADSFGVSDSTIRRDLNDLEEKGYVKRTHGGAILKENFDDEYNFIKKTTENRAEKSSIARYAASLIEDGEIIAINSSTLTYLMAKELEAANLKIVSNSIDVINELSGSKKYDISVLGGDYVHLARTIEGPITEKQIRAMHFDKAFLGVNGIDSSLGLSTASSIEALSKKAMIDCSEQSFILSESPKFDKASFYKIADFDEIDAIITDQNLSEDKFDKYSQYLKIIKTQNKEE